MLTIASLISDPVRPAVSTELAGRVAAALPGARPPVWLAEGVAADIPFAGEADAALLRDALRGAPVDLNLLPAEGRRKRLFVADMDSTMIEQECLDELADLVGLKPHVAAITERAMRGEIAFEPALTERVALLKDLPIARIQTLLRDRITDMPGGRTLVATMRAHGARTVLVSGGFTLFTQPVAARLGFDEHHGNRLGMHDDVLTGTVEPPILGRSAKRDTLAGLRDALGLAHEDTLAAGDGANDLDMLAEAGLGVAFRAKPAVAETARARIDHGDLTALLYLQGYRREEFRLS